MRLRARARWLRPVEAPADVCVQLCVCQELAPCCQRKSFWFWQWVLIMGVESLSVVGARIGGHSNVIVAEVDVCRL